MDVAVLARRLVVIVAYTGFFLLRISGPRPWGLHHAQSGRRLSWPGQPPICRSWFLQS